MSPIRKTVPSPISFSRLSHIPNPWRHQTDRFRHQPAATPQNLATPSFLSTRVVDNLLPALYREIIPNGSDS
ncbi:hypothetical protein Hanom_Chr05g00467301 [Helianthus anomalus]